MNDLHRDEPMPLPCRAGQVSLQAQRRVGQQGCTDPLDSSGCQLSSAQWSVRAEALSCNHLQALARREGHQHRAPPYFTSDPAAEEQKAVLSACIAYRQAVISSNISHSLPGRMDYLSTLHPWRLWTTAEFKAHFVTPCWAGSRHLSWRRQGRWSEEKMDKCTDAAVSAGLEVRGQGEGSGEVGRGCSTSESAVIVQHSFPLVLRSREARKAGKMMQEMGKIRGLQKAIPFQREFLQNVHLTS